MIIIYKRGTNNISCSVISVLHNSWGIIDNFSAYWRTETDHNTSQDLRVLLLNHRAKLCFTDHIVHACVRGQYN